MGIWKALAAILHLGNVKLEDAGDGESSVVGNKDVVRIFLKFRVKCYKKLQ